MEPKFQSSFIPKKPVVDSPKMLGPVSKNVNIFSVIATIAFIITMAGSGWVFIYGRMIESDLKNADKELVEVRAAFEADKIQDLISESTRLDSIYSLLKKHYAVSQVLVLLQDLTLKNMRFDNLSYRAQEGKPTIAMDVEANGYNSIAYQKEVFEESGLLSAVSFSSFSLGDGGVVKSKFNASVSPKLVSFEQHINSINGTTDSSVNQESPNIQVPEVNTGQ